MASTGNTSPESSLDAVNADSKFLRFLLGDLFNDGTHVWWLIGLCCVITLTAVVFSFFGAIVDSDFLFDTHAAKKNQYLAKHENDESRKMLMLTRSRKELNYPYLPVELDTDYTSYIKRGNAALICERKQM